MQTHRKPNVYLIPGMGADYRLYERIRIEGAHVHHLDWKPPGNSRDMREYAHVMAGHIQTEDNVIVGSSMGGMMAVELSRIVRPLGTVLLAAPTGRHEFPRLLKVVDKIGLQHALGPRQVMRISRLADTFMGFRKEEERALFYEMLRGNGEVFLHFSVRAVLGWKNTEPPHGDYLQVIGSKDKLFKAHRMQQPRVIEGSGHFMTFEKSDEVNSILREYLETVILPKLVTK